MAQTTVIQEAAKLVSIKKKINDLLLQVDEMKQKLLPYVRLAPMKVSGGSVTYVQGSESFYLNRAKMLDVLTKVLKLSPQMAEKMIQLGAAKRIVKDYVKVLTEA